MELKSVFEEGERIPEKYTCDGDNVNPPLEITNIPEKTRSMVLVIDDPDAPRKIWVHWVVWNIFPVERIEENSVPQKAIQGINDFGKRAYVGPYPPDGIHRYKFRIYALNTVLNLDSSAEKADVEKAMKGKILDEATLTGLYSKSG